MFAYAIATERARNNPAVGLEPALEKAEESHHATVIDPPEAGQLLRLVWSYMGTGVIVSNALKALAYTFQRSGNIVKMEWSEINLDEASWIIPWHKMKGGRRRRKQGEDHLVPLACQVIELLKDQQGLPVGFYRSFT